MSRLPVYALISYTSDGYVRTVNDYRSEAELHRAALAFARREPDRPYQTVVVSQQVYVDLYQQATSALPPMLGERAAIEPLAPGPVPPRPPSPKDRR